MTTLYYYPEYKSYFIIVDGNKVSTSLTIKGAFYGNNIGSISEKVFTLMTADRDILFQHETSDPVEAYRIFESTHPEYFI